MIGAHRFVLWATCGYPEHESSITSDQLIEWMDIVQCAHTCENKRCINFKHLQWCLAAENNMRTQGAYNAMQERSKTWRNDNAQHALTDSVLALSNLHGAPQPAETGSG